jgi:hypothetical protein
VKARLSPKLVVGAVFVASMFLNIMDATVVNVALPTLSRYFAVPVASVSGVVTAYLVTLAVVMPVSGWVGDRFGARSVMLGAIPARRADQTEPAADRADADGACARAGDRRPAGGRAVLAVDLLPQPAGRGGRARLRRAVPAARL